MLERFVTSERKEFVFIDGNLYLEEIKFGCYKGIGWLGGRTCDVIFEGGNIPLKGIDVYLLDLNYGKLRRCAPDIEKSKIYKKTIYTVIDDPATVMEDYERKQKGL